MLALQTMLSAYCRVFARLPSAATSTIGGDGARYFRRPGTVNLITIYLRLRDGTRAACIRPDDVQLVAFDADHKPVRARVQLIIAGGSEITLQYTLDGHDCQLMPANLRVCVRACGVSLMNARVHAAAFDGRTAGRLCGKYVLAGTADHTAIHPAGTHLVVSSMLDTVSNVYKLPGMNLTAGNSPNNSGLVLGLCFTAAGTLLVALHNDQVQHWTLEGQSIASYAIRAPCCVASCNNIVAVGTHGGVHVCSLENGVVLHAWLRSCWIHAVVFTDAEILVVSDCTRNVIELHAPDGRFLKQLAANIISASLAARADGCLLVSDYFRNRIRVFAPDGAELTTSPFSVHTFPSHPRSISLCGARAYVLESNIVSMFE